MAFCGEIIFKYLTNDQARLITDKLMTPMWNTFHLTGFRYDPRWYYPGSLLTIQLYNTSAIMYNTIINFLKTNSITYDENDSWFVSHLNYCVEYCQ